MVRMGGVGSALWKLVAARVVFNGEKREVGK